MDHAWHLTLTWFLLTCIPSQIFANIFGSYPHSRLFLHQNQNVSSRYGQVILKVEKIQNEVVVAEKMI